MLGLVRACPENRLSIFAGLDADTLARADQLHAMGLITVELIDTEGLLIHITARGKADVVQARIRGGHTRVDLVQVNGENIPFDATKAGIVSCIL